MTKHSSESGDYSFELDVSDAAVDFGGLSNSYTMVSPCARGGLECVFIYIMEIVCTTCEVLLSLSVEPSFSCRV